MVGPERISATALSREAGIGQPTLSRWARDARTLATMSKKKSGGSKKGSSQWTAAEKMKAVLEASALSDEQLGAFLRERGLHEARLDEWRATMLESLRPAKKKGSKKSPEAARLKELERDLRRKEKALAEVMALLALKKKLEAILGDGADDTDTRGET
jgi:hypothetical protein